MSSCAMRMCSSSSHTLCSKPGARAPRVSAGRSVDRLVEADVRFFPVEQADELFAKTIVAHARHYDPPGPRRMARPRR